MMAAPDLRTRMAQTPCDLQAAQRLRYDVFVTEMGARAYGDGATKGLEADRYDAAAQHLLLEDLTRPAGSQVVGVYRLLDQKAAQDAGQFYCADEFDLSPLLQSGLRVLELGRSCLHRDYRGGAGLMHLWSALAQIVQDAQIDLLFGAASFHGTDVKTLAQPLSYLHHNHRAPAAICPVAIGANAITCDQLTLDQIDRRAAAIAMPALVKAYLRLGGCVGQGAYVDHDFQTTDVCLILETSKIDPKRLAQMTQGPKP